jgi:hypothetical protein
MKMRETSRRTRRIHSAPRTLAVALASILAGSAALTTPAQAVVLTQDELGDAIIYQYYTAKNGWQTFFRIINTSPDAVVVKVRFREAANSREVLDFEVALSPEDMWTGWTDANALGDGRPGIRSNDTSCVFPLVGQSFPNDEGFKWLNRDNHLYGALFKDRAFTGVYDDNGPYADDTARRMAEGHFEIIGIASYPSTGSADGFAHAISHNGATGEPNDCQTAYRMYQLGDDGRGGLSDQDVDNVLAANAYLVNIASGQGAGYDPNVLADCSTARRGLRALAVATDTSPDLDDCDAGLWGRGGVAINQALWDGTTPPPITTTIYQVDAVGVEGPPGDGRFTGSFSADIDGDGQCTVANGVDETNIQENDVPQEVYDAARSTPTLLIEAGRNDDQNCDFIVADSNPNPDAGALLTDTRTERTFRPWRIKQKGQLIDQTPVVGGVDWVSSQFMATSVINEWAADFNPDAVITDYFTQWVVTFPTKHYYVDLQDDLNLADDISPTLAATVPESFAPFVQIFPGNGRSCEPVTIEMWNREERWSAFTSPAPTPEDSLCWETNVVTFNDRYQDAGLDSDFGFVIDELWLPTNYDGTVAERGWARMTFDGFGATRTGLTAPFDGPFLGLPVTGFLFSVYETGAAATNHTAINAHKYVRERGRGE